MGWLTERWKCTLARALTYVGGGTWLESNPNMQPFILSLIAGAAFADSMTWLFRSIGLFPLHLKEEFMDLAIMLVVIFRFSDQAEVLRGFHGAELGGGFLGFMTVFLTKVLFYYSKQTLPSSWR